MSISKDKYYSGKSEPLRSAFGQVIREVRESRGMGQIDLAVAIDRAQSFVSEVESGTRNITLEIIHELCTELDIKVSDAFQRAESLLR